MRLRRLDLTRYGKFTDRSIDFGERIEGAPDLHIVYGPNEAGKSTAFAAFLDLLFGIETQSRYGFLHPYSTMRIGACLELSCDTRELVRIKRPLASLRNSADEPVADATILGDLSGLDRNAYRMMFSLDDDTLEAGGNAILASRGELGQLLFSANAGLAGLGKMLIDLKAGTDKFTKPNARSGELSDLKAELLRLKQSRDDIDTLASEYNRLAANRDLTASQYEAALDARAAVQSRLDHVQLLLNAQPRMAALGELHARMSKLPELPDAPPGWLDELPALQDDETRHRAEAEHAGAEVQRLRQAVEAISVDERALTCAGRLERLAELRVRVISAEIDLPERLGERALAQSQAHAILLRLGRTQESEPARLLLNAAQSAVLNTLIVSRSGVQADVSLAAKELSDALAELTEARRALHEAGQDHARAPMAPVREAIAALQRSDHAVRLRSAAIAKTQHAETLAARLTALTPWAASVADLAAAPVPDAATLEAWSVSAQQSAASIQQRQHDVERHEAECARRAAECDAIGQTAGLLSDKEAAEIRAAREAAWAQHRRALDAATADAFEAALRRDDIVTGARARHERDLAQLHAATCALANERAAGEREAALLGEAIAARDRQAEALTSLTAGIGMTPPAFLSAAWLLGWLARREKALESWELLRQAERDQAAAIADEAALRRRLSAALGPPVDPDASLDELARAAQEGLDQQARIDQLVQAVTRAERQVRKREAEMQRTALADKAWFGAWRQACAACWLGEEAADWPIEVVREMLSAAAELATVLAAQRLAVNRIAQMQDVQDALRRELAVIGPALGIEPGQQSAPDLAQAIVETVTQATRAAQQRQKLTDELARAQEELCRVEVESRHHAARAGEMMDLMQASSLIELAGRLHDAELKADLRRQSEQAERDITSMLHAGSLADAQAMLATHDGAELTIEAAKLAPQLKDFQERTNTLFAASKEAADAIAAVGGDDAAAMIEARRRTILLTIEDKARGYLRQRLGIAAAERALRAYRDQHRSAMMRQASDAFRIISRGAYRGLGTQPDRDGAGEVLIALGADGGSKLAVDLSKGTRFQLYLALRAAGYQEFAKLRPPVPFIADDIMETFDDFRAEETLRVLEGMARLGQVIYLTHHDHLRAIAERTTPGVRIHELAA